MRAHTTWMVLAVLAILLLCALAPALRYLCTTRVELVIEKDLRGLIRLNFPRYGAHPWGNVAIAIGELDKDKEGIATKVLPFGNPRMARHTFSASLSDGTPLIDLPCGATLRARAETGQPLLHTLCHREGVSIYYFGTYEEFAEYQRNPRILLSPPPSPYGPAIF